MIGFALGLWIHSCNLLEPMPKKEALDFLDTALYSHQYFVDNPDECTKWTGDVESNLESVEKYKRIIALIEECE